MSLENTVGKDNSVETRYNYSFSGNVVYILREGCLENAANQHEFFLLQWFLPCQKKKEHHTCLNWIWIDLQIYAFKLGKCEFLSIDKWHICGKVPIHLQAKGWHSEGMNIQMSLLLETMAQQFLACSKPLKDVKLCKFKAFADNNWHWIPYTCLSQSKKRCAEKRRKNAGYQHFLLFLQRFHMVIC